MNNQEAPRLSGFLAGTLPRISVTLGIIGLAVTALLWRAHPHQVAFSYLTAFLFFMSVTLGSLFFVIIHHLARAGWNVVVRRIAEVLSNNVILMALLFIPVLFGMHELYHWTHAESVLHDHLLQVKSPYLNIPFFLIRAAVFFGAWIFLARRFFKKSVEQDQTGDPKITLGLQGLAAAAILIFGITQTFAAVDWAMSITPHWYSTMFGVYFFAGSVLSAMAIISLVALLLRRFGFMADIIRKDHYHDLAKFAYGINIFWAYVSFSQYFLIWYANIPEESVWFVQHFKGNWNTVAILLAVGHFFLPFVVFMSQHARRNLTVHAIVMAWFVVMHIVDVYWLIMPNVSPDGLHVSLSDITAFVGIGGLYIGLFFLRLRKVPLFPQKDPRLSESLHYHT
ncbi:hypothetical protein EBR96_02905 [bacterium]|nr:hypothetical protein [bacterium]